jgi:hypothetical protein
LALLGAIGEVAVAPEAARQNFRSADRQNLTDVGQKRSQKPTDWNIFWFFDCQLQHQHILACSKSSAVHILTMVDGWKDHDDIYKQLFVEDMALLLGEAFDPDPANSNAKTTKNRKARFKRRFKPGLAAHRDILLAYLEKKKNASCTFDPDGMLPTGSQHYREVSLEPSTPEHDNGFSDSDEFHTPSDESPNTFYFTPLSNTESQDRVSPSVNARKVLTFSDEADEDMPTTAATATATATATIHETTVDDVSMEAASTLLELFRHPQEEEDDDDKTEDEMDTQGDDDLSDRADLGADEAASLPFIEMEMASLLNIFVPANLTIPIEEQTHKNWLKEKELNHIRLTFEQRFGHLTPSACALLRSDSQVPPGGMVAIKSLVGPYLATLRARREKLNEEIKRGQDKNRASTVAETRFREVQMGEKLPIIKRISLLLGKNATELAHDGTSTYAEPTQAGIIRIAEKLRELMGPSRRDQMLIDCGSGVGTALWIMCQVLDCKGLGLEYSTNRVFSGCAKTKNLLDELEGNLAFQFRVANMHGDLHDLEALFKDLVGAYQYDEAFAPYLMVKMFELYSRAPLTFRFVVCAKSQRYPAYGKEMYEDYGLYPLTLPISCKKVGSGEASSFVIFGRRCCDYSDLSGKVLEPPETTTPYPMPAPDYKPPSLPAEVARILDGDMEAAKQHYTNLYVDMETRMSKSRTRAPSQDVSCTSWEQFEHCKDTSCESCESAFEHTDVRELYAQPVPWLPGQNGLFTGNDLGIGRYVIGYTGKKSTCRLNGSYVLEVSPGMFVDAKGRGLQQYINHSCDPNCIFQKWNDSRGSVRVSIATRRAIKEDEELTVNYGSSREAFACECQACKGFTKAILLLGMTGLSEHRLQQRLGILQSLNVNNMCRAMLKMRSKIDQKLRDNLRLFALQQEGWRTYTISLEPMDRDERLPPGEGASSHFTCDWNRAGLITSLEEMRITVDTIQLDNYWMPNGYTFEKAKPAFYKKTLPNLRKFIRVGGTILLPAQVYMLDGLLSNRESWEPFFELHLLGATERKAQCPLYAGMEVLKKVVGKENVDAALGKNGAHNTKYTHITDATLGEVSAEGRQLCENQGFPVCLLELKLRSAGKPIPSKRGKRPSKVDLERSSKTARTRKRPYKASKTARTRKRPSKAEVEGKRKASHARNGANTNAAPLKPMSTLSSIKKPFERDGIVILSARSSLSLSIAHAKQLCDWATSYLTRLLDTIDRKALAAQFENHGFDVIRLRGKGRYEMVPPAGELEKYMGFLQDTKAPWMPAIHQLLGPSVRLIQRGFFVLEPGGEMQDYHQDAPDAEARYAVNVFVSLIDMSRELGPTEFVKGSHAPGKEDFNKHRTDAPILQAGQPLIFNYRLGHRGLPNKHTSVTRFMYYCTYSICKNGKPLFEDKNNFDRKRYKALGPLFEVPASRDERMLARARGSQPPNVDACVQESSCALRRSKRTCLEVRNRQRLQMLTPFCV